MFLDINKIGATEHPFDHAPKLPTLQDSAGQTVHVRDLRVVGRAARGSKGVHLHATIQARLELICGRCLAAFEQELDDRFFLILVPDAVELAAGRREVSDDDAALYYTTEGKAAVADIAREQLLLRLPLKPICKSDCHGLCPSCGIDRNDTTCDCAERSVDPRLASLVEIKNKMA